jgi:Fic family protein
MTSKYQIPLLPLPYDLETREVLKQVNKSNKKLAELKGIAGTIPNEKILINSLILQEARDSSAIENIVTTQDDLYHADTYDTFLSHNPAIKEVLRYRESIMEGYNIVKKKRMLSNNVIKQIQQQLVDNNAGFRTTPGTTLRRGENGEVVYTPPQDINEIEQLMSNLEVFINDSSMCTYDPLIKMAIIHHQFESIHPFYDGNGRTGRIINILYLVYMELLDMPILYLSKYITHNKAEYYRLLQAIRNKDTNNTKEWTDWILFILKGVEDTSAYTIQMIKNIATLMAEYKSKLKPAFGNKYKHELLNNLFFHPYTKIEFMQNDMMIGRITAAKYLDSIVELGLLTKMRRGKENYYINNKLMNLFVQQGEYHSETTIETVHNTNK